MPRLDLAPIQAMMEQSILDDLLRIYPPTDGHLLRGTLNPDTGRRDPAPDSPPVWEGVGAMVPAAGGALLGTPPIPELTVPDMTNARYRCLLPLAVPAEVAKGYVVEVYGSMRADGPRDPRIVGRRFVLQDSLPVSTFAVVRVMMANAEESDHG